MYSSKEVGSKTGGRQYVSCSAVSLSRVMWPDIMQSPGLEAWLKSCIMLPEVWMTSCEKHCFRGVHSMVQTCIPAKERLSKGSKAGDTCASLRQASSTSFWLAGPPSGVP